MIINKSDQNYRLVELNILKTPTNKRNYYTDILYLFRFIQL